MTTRPHPSRRRGSPLARGFTLVELMVAVTGGLIVAMIVFGLAREGTRIYRQESRAADATLAAMVGYNRLSLDLAHAGFLSTPNIRTDPRLCGTVDATWPAELARLASVRITPMVPIPTLLAANGRTPDQIVITGSLTNPEEFTANGVQAVGANQYVVTLADTGALARFGYVSADATGRTQILSQLFPPGRGLRLRAADRTFQLATIVNTGIYQNKPAIWVSGALILRGPTATSCGLGDPFTGVVNVINIVRYRLMDVQSANLANYRALFEAQASEMQTWDVGRTELVREELGTDGTPIADTLEVVAEYAVDLEFGVTAITGMNGAEPTGVQSFGFDDDSAVATYAGAIGAGAATPERLRGIRARLSVRSRVPDRQNNVTAGGTIAPGFYRMGIGPGGSAPFARVRTLQAEIALRNHEAVTW